MAEPIKNPLWAGPCLLVPITLDALLIGTPNQIVKDRWARVAMDYEQLPGNLDPAPGPFQIGKPPEVGVHLHWTLPAALRHGRQPEESSPDIEFPNVPDRWLITRFFRANPGDKPAVVVWVLQSDFLGKKKDGGTRAYPLAEDPTEVLYLGKRFTLAAWDGPAPPAEPFLTAPGPGDLSWAAVYDNVRNVFGFHDPLTGEPNGNYSYSVLGWYAKPSTDPLYGQGSGFTSLEQWKQLMASLQWAVGSGDDLDTRIAEARLAFQTWLAANPVEGGPPATPAQKEYASQTLCQSLLFNIAWKGPQAPYPTPPIFDSLNPPELAIGSTSAEAIGAWMGKRLAPQTPDSVEDLINAFQLDRIFDWVSDPTGFATAAHDARFATARSGQVWVVTREPDRKEEGRGGVQQIPLDLVQTAKLTELNAKQLELNGKLALLETQRWAIFSAGWKLDNLPDDKDQYRTQISNTIKALTASIGTLTGQIAAMTGERDQLAAALKVLLGTKYELSLIDVPPFDSPADPVVLIAGAATDTKLEQPKWAEVFLFTRFTGQTLGGLRVTFDGIRPSTPPVTLTYDDLRTPVTFPAGKAPIPKEAMNVWVEAMLLDLGNSQWLATLAFTKAGVINPPPTADELTALTKRIAVQQTLIWNAGAQLDRQTIAEAVGLQPLDPRLQVIVPSKLSVSTWTPPWTPLYLDWRIEFHPTAATPQKMLDGWTLDEFEFRWGGEGIPTTFEPMVMRSLLSSDFAKGLGEKLNDFIDTTPKLQQLPVIQRDQLKETAATLRKLDVLTQSMTGLVQRMIMQQIRPTIPLKDEAAHKLSADVMRWVPTPGGIGFYPIRAGHFQVKDLWVVDAYGQILRTRGAFAIPIRSKSLRTAGETNKSYMQLVPRVAQGSRLDFRFVDSEDDQLRSNSSDATSPICGWLLPNHLDNSLMVFDAAGVSLGELLKIERDAGTGVRWDAAPGRDDPFGTGPNIANAHLRELVNGLLAAGRSGTRALDQLLDLIDVTLWATDPLGTDSTGNLSVLLGRPIAVVRTALTVKLDGDPATNQQWEKTGQGDTANFTSVRFPHRIGDFGLSGNGALGYFMGNAYDACFAMFGYERAMGEVRKLVREPGLGQLRARLSARSGPGAGAAASVAPTGDPDYVITGNLIQLPPDGTTTNWLTVLVDPRGAIPAITGYQPVEALALPNGPVSLALSSMAATFRMGPLLLDPNAVRMPLPADSGGKWSWIERTGVTFWNEQGPLQPSQPEATLPIVVPTLREGWLKLSGALGAQGEGNG